MRNLFRVLGAVLDHPPRYLAANITDFPFEVAYACFPRVRANDLAQRIIGEDDVFL
jgi:hypothetical protein